MEHLSMLDDKKVVLLLEDIQNKYGYDFLNYSRASIMRRISRLLEITSLSEFEEMRSKLLEDEAFFEIFLQEVTVNLTEMFRDPELFQALREKVYAELSFRPLIRIWHAGCATGEEVYSNAIALQEENLLQRSLIYATDINQKVLDYAKEGIFNISRVQQSTKNYIKAGGSNNLSDYYHSSKNVPRFSDILREKMVFSAHNLAHDQSFNEFNLIMCRNVMIYFNNDLQNTVLKLFTDSLSRFGYLVLGLKESIQFSDYSDRFELIDKKLRIYKKID